MGSGASTEDRNGLLVNGVWPEGHPNAGAEAGITNSVVRNALNLSAWYPSFSTWDPSAVQCQFPRLPLHTGRLGCGEHVQYPTDDRASERHADDA